MKFLVLAFDAQEAPFHAKAAKRVRGALGISIVVKIINNKPDLDTIVAKIIITAIIASLTVSGKALGKILAINRANDVIFWAGKFLANWEKLTGRSLISKARPKT